MIYVNPLKASSNADCSSVAWVNDNEAWALCKQNVTSGTTTVNIPLFLVRIRPNDAEKVKVFGTIIGVGPDLANKNYYSLASNSLLVDGNYLVVGGGVGSGTTDTKSFLAKFSIASEPPTTGWAPEIMMKYGPVNNVLSGLAKMTSGSSSYYVTLNRGGGRYFLGKHNSSDLTDVPSSSGVVPGFFSSVQLPSYDVTKMKLCALIVNGSNLYLAGSYDDNAVIVALKDDGALNTDFNARSSTDSAGVLRLKPANQVFQIKGADENIVFGQAELTAIRVTSTGGLIGIGAVSYAAPASVHFSAQVAYYGGLVVELDSTASSTPIINAHVGAPYDWNSTYYRQGEMVGSRLVVAGYKQFFVSAATTGGFYQSFNKKESGYEPTKGLDTCLVELPKKMLKSGELLKDFKLFINNGENPSDSKALGYLNSNFSNKIGLRRFRIGGEQGVTAFEGAELRENNCSQNECSYSEPDIQFFLGGNSAFRIQCQIAIPSAKAENKVELRVSVARPDVKSRILSSLKEKAEKPIISLYSTESAVGNFYSDPACSLPFSSPGPFPISKQEIQKEVGPIPENQRTPLYVQVTSAGRLKSECLLTGNYIRDTLPPKFASALLKTSTPNKTLTPDIAIEGYEENEDVVLDIFKDPSCKTSIAQERTVAAPFLRSVRLFSGIKENTINPLYVRIRDLAGNESPCVFVGNFQNDSSAPIISEFKINNGDAGTTSRIVNLLLKASPDAVEYCVSNSNPDDCTFIPFTSQTITWTLSEGEGEKIVYVKVRDQAGNISLFSGDTIVYQPVTPPGPPRNLAGTQLDGVVSLRWEAPTNDGGQAIEGYIVELSSDNGATFIAQPKVYQPYAGVGGLTNGAKYIFRVKAVNAVGIGQQSNILEFVPFGRPGAPENVAVAVGDKQAKVTWDAPKSNGGNAIKGYSVSYSTDQGASWALMSIITVRSQTVSYLTNGKSYIFNVVAINDLGQGPASKNSAAVIPFGTPHEPLNLAGVPGNGQVTLTWAAPSNNGGKPVTGYVVEYSEDPRNPFMAGPTTPTTTATVTGLTNGKKYFFKVAAINSYGKGTPAWTPYDQPITPAAPKSCLVDNNHTFLTQDGFMEHIREDYKSGDFNTPTAKTGKTWFNYAQTSYVDWRLCPKISWDERGHSLSRALDFRDPSQDGTYILRIHRNRNRRESNGYNIAYTWNNRIKWTGAPLSNFNAHQDYVVTCNFQTNGAKWTCSYETKSLSNLNCARLSSAGACQELKVATESVQSSECRNIFDFFKKVEETDYNPYPWLKPFVFSSLKDQLRRSVCSGF